MKVNEKCDQAKIGIYVNKILRIETDIKFSIKDSNNKYTG
jgi:hypothetical protein